jgi:hypothetical protein
MIRRTTCFLLLESTPHRFSQPQHRATDACVMNYTVAGLKLVPHGEPPVMLADLHTFCAFE